MVYLRGSKRPVKLTAWPLTRCSAAASAWPSHATRSTHTGGAWRSRRSLATEIALCLAMPVSTVPAVLSRIGLGKLSRRDPPNRYERRHPAELLHVDVKTLGRIRGAGHRMTGSRASQKRARRNGKRTGVAGWEFVHVRPHGALRHKTPIARLNELNNLPRFYG